MTSFFLHTQNKRENRMRKIRDTEESSERMRNPDNSIGNSPTPNFYDTQIEYKRQGRRYGNCFLRCTESGIWVYHSSFKMVLLLLKPLVIIWASFSILDDLTIVAKLAKLIQKGHFHSGNQSPEAICDMCDEVMEDILRGAETLSTVPCSWICLGGSRCMKMCENIQELSLKSTEFPCVAAGYCAVEDDYALGFESEIACKKGPLFSCEPKKFCRKRRAKFSFKYTCDLKYVKIRWFPF